MDELGKLMVVYSRNLPKLRAAAYSVVQNMDEAEDVVQDTIVKFVDNPERCRAVDNPLAFLRTCVRNEAISHLRKKSNETPAFDFVLASAKATVAAEEYKKIENLLYVRSYVEKMSPAFRDAFVRHVLDGWTIVSLAKELGVSAEELQRQFRIVKNRMRTDPAILFTIYFLTF